MLPYPLLDRPAIVYKELLSSLLKVRIPLFDGHKLLQATSHFRTFLSLVGNIYTLLGPRQPNKSGPYPVGFDFCVFGCCVSSTAAFLLLKAKTPEFIVLIPQFLQLGL
jgi:hypothetical protein